MPRNRVYVAMEPKVTRRELLALGVGSLTLPGCRLLSIGRAGLEYREADVVGGMKDLLNVRFIRLKGSNRDIGAKLGEVARTRHRTRLLAESPQIAERRAFYKTSYPALYDRGAGVLKTWGLESDPRPIDPYMLMYNMDIAPACSTVFYPGSSTTSGHATLSRNYDFSTGTFGEVMGLPTRPGARSMTGDPYVIEMHPDGGIPALYLCAYDLLAGCIDGMNAEGLSVALLANDYEPGQPKRGPHPGLGEIEITRYLLDTCRDADEARSVLEKTPVYYSFIGCHYIVGDRKGRSFVFEYSPDLGKRFFVEGKGKPQAVTNHPLHQFEGKELPAEPEYGSFARYSRLQKEIAARRGKMSIDDIKATNRCVMQRFTPVGSTGRPLGRTLWHSIYDLEARTLEVDFYLGEDPSEGELKQRRSGYRKFTL